MAPPIGDTTLPDDAQLIIKLLASEVRYKERLLLPYTPSTADHSPISPTSDTASHSLFPSSSWQGITDYEPQIIHQLLDYMYSYTALVLQDASLIHSQTTTDKKSDIELTLNDIMAAIDFKGQRGGAVSTTITREMLERAAQRINKEKLPELEERHGIRRPADVESLVMPTFQIATKKGKGRDGEENGTDEAAVPMETCS